LSFSGQQYLKINIANVFYFFYK
jgi:hypothetical protein